MSSHSVAVGGAERPQPRVPTPPNCYISRQNDSQTRSHSPSRRRKSTRVNTILQRSVQMNSSQDLGSAGTSCKARCATGCPLIQLISLAASASSQEVSWQSAFWPVIACTLTVMLQNTGSVLDADIRLSGLVKSSAPFCLVDTIHMLIGVGQMISAGCSFRKAVTYIWHARFENTGEALSSSALQLHEVALESSWKLSLLSFLLGGLPQAIKIFGMRGIPFTQAVVAVFLATFVIGEIFRLVAIAPHSLGSPGEHPMPTIESAKIRYRRAQKLMFPWVFSLHFMVYIPRVLNKSSQEHARGWISALGFAAYGLIIGLSCLPILFGCLQVRWFRSWVVLSASRIRKARAFNRFARFFTRVVKDLGELFLLHPDDVKFLLLPAIVSLPLQLLFPVLKLHTRFFSMLEQQKFLFCSFFGMTFVFSHLYCALIWLLIFRLAFTGSLSRKPRQLLRLGGSESEYYVSLLVLSSFYLYFKAYYLDFDGEGTYKPNWTEKLG
jgi:hypothetical protein